MGISWALARDADVGVVIAECSVKLSRMWHWDLRTDEFTPGQFLKGRAYVADISPDGRYVVTFALVYHRPERAYIGVSHIPYFTALAYFPTSPVSGGAWFREDGALCVNDNPLLSIENGRGSPFPERIDPGCPFPIIRDAEWDDTLKRDWSNDARRDRLITTDRRSTVEADHCSIFATDPTKTRKLLGTFLREPFESIPPPDWATRW